MVHQVMYNVKVLGQLVFNCNFQPLQIVQIIQIERNGGKRF